jgi:hypothetical protein
MERQAQNFPIQGLVADAVSRSVDHLYAYREENPDLTYKICLQIHDAVVLLVKDHQVERVIDKVFPECMVNRVPIWPCSLDGVPLSSAEKPYHLGIDTEIHHHWGVDMFPDECIDRGIKPSYAGWSRDKQIGGYVNFNAFPKMYWSTKTRSMEALSV